jgi:hypothetical protein
MPRDAQSNVADIINMLESFRRAILAGSSYPDDADFVGNILEQNLREIFDRRPVPSVDDYDSGAGRKRFDLAFLLVKESNRALRERRPDQALGFVAKAISLWGEQKSDGAK